MQRALTLHQTTIGKKVVMALSGLIIVGFVIGHFLGNLNLYRGQEALDDYAHLLQSLTPVLWGTRLLLLFAFGAHIVSAFSLWSRNMKARGSRYKKHQDMATDYAARTMYWSGPILLLFVVYHLLHFTILPAHPGEVYRNVVEGFQNPLDRRRVHHGQHRPWLSHLPRHLQRGPNAGREPSALQRLPPRCGNRDFRRDHHRQPVVSDLGARWFRHLVRVVMQLRSNEPTGPIEHRWEKHKESSKLVAPANRRKYTVIVVGSGLAGGAAAASLGEMGYNVKCFCYQDSPRRAHSIAAQGGINAAKDYQNDGDSVYRLFYDTVKGGDFRSRESNVYRLAQLSVNIIDQAVAQGVPFAREYGGLLANRSFGGAQVSRTFYARGQTGQQLLLGAYQALSRQIEEGTVEMLPRTEMLDLIVHDGRARGIVTRCLKTGKISPHIADMVVLCTGGYGNVFYLSTNAKGCNCMAVWRAHRHGAAFANPCYTQIHPTCIPQSGSYQSKLTLMSESLRNDGRVWVPRKKEDVSKRPEDIPEEDRYYYLEERYPAFGNLVPRDVASRNALYVTNEGLGVGMEVDGERRGVYLDFSDAINRLGEQTIRERYGNLFEMYERIAGDNPYKTPMRIYPATHYTMGGLWVDYNLQTTIPGLFSGGEANFSDHGANRLGASALMQGLADGYFVLPFTVGNYLGEVRTLPPLAEDHPDVTKAVGAVEERIHKLMNAPEPKHAPEYFHRKLGRIIWTKCGMSRNKEGLEEALREIPKLRDQFWREVKIVGSGAELNQTLERAGRVADFFELGELMCIDALQREESCGGHFREEHEENGEALRDDEHFSYVSAWEWSGNPGEPRLHKEPLTFEYVKPSKRSYK